MEMKVHQPNLDVVSTEELKQALQKREQNKKLVNYSFTTERHYYTQGFTITIEVPRDPNRVKLTQLTQLINLWNGAGLFDEGHYIVSLKRESEEEKDSDDC